MKEVVIVDYLRSPISRARPTAPERDVLNEFRMDAVLGQVVKTMVDRKGINKKEIDEVLVGCALQVGEQFLYGGRSIVGFAELPETVPAIAMDRQCGSSMSTIHIGAMEIMTGQSDIIISGGIEHMTHVPMTGNEMMDPPMALASEEKYAHYDFETGFVMGFTAEKLFKKAADKFGLTREDLDEWAYISHARTGKAIAEGFFKDEIMPLESENGVLDRDYAPRPPKEGQTKEEYIEKLASLYPVFDVDGVITAGNSSPLNAGATGAILMSKEKAKEYGFEPLATIKSMGVAAVNPGIMGHGPVPASQKALKNAGLQVSDIDYWEINEAFAVVVLNCIKELGIDPEIVNVKGGAIAIGHPLGATGTRLVGTLARILNWNDGQIGLANACIGGGQGIATIIEKGG